MATSTDLLAWLHASGHVGRANPAPLSDVARALGVSPRVVQALKAELIEDGELVGSVCTQPSPGIFLIVDEEDLAVGTAHTRARAAASFQMCRRLEASAAERFGAHTASLFDLAATA